MINSGLILVLSQHPVFGWKFNIHSAELTESGNIQILGTPTAKQEEKRGTPEKIIRMIKLAENISDQVLMKDYSKKKTFVEFKKELTEETLERYIRPRIESTNLKIVEIAKHTNISVFLRENLSNKFLYERLNLTIIKTPAKCLFNFVKDDKGFRYFISLTNDGKEISLQAEQALIISEKPSIILIDSEIHCVENIESKKLVPFFNKEYIAVPPSSEETYLKNFVLKTMLQYEVKIQGISVKEIIPRKEALLILEKDFKDELVLSLWFLYNDQNRINPFSGKKKTIWLEKIDGIVTICWYKRDIEWESSLLNKLEKERLVNKNTNQFHLDMQNDSYSLIEWLNKKEKTIRKYFTLEQSLVKEYFTGNISIQTSIDEKIDWFDVNIVVVAGEFKIPFNRFRKYILNGNKDFVLPDQKVMILPDEWFEKYRELFKLSRDTGTSIQVKKLHTPLLQHALTGQFSQTKEEKIFSNVFSLSATRPELPKQVKTDLRPYQKEGFYWLTHLYTNGFGACLADDMGLGKTLQTITLLQHIYSASEQKQTVASDGQLSLFDSSQSVLPASLIVVPTSLLHNWKNELQRFAPELKVFVYAGNERLKTKKNENAFYGNQVVITSYGVLRNDINFLQYCHFQLIILDESQYIKNPTSLSYKSVIKLTSEHRLVLTGTPIENSLEDLWAQFNFINEGLLGNFSAFKKDFIQPIIKGKNTDREALLKKMIHPFILRRTKEEVAPELPPLTQEIVFCSMTEEHQEAYNTEKNRVRNLILEAKEHPEQPKERFIALEGLNKLRQLANHPKLLFADYKEDSGKFEQIIMSFQNLKATNHKVLIFSSYVKHLKILTEKFDKEGWKYALLTGETVKREEEIKRFTENKDVSCFFISLKAGSTGLNLTAADYVFIIDPWWNPAAEMQALSRAHRIGQSKPVIVYRFISSETIEEKILYLQESKTSLYETFIDTNNPLNQLNWNEIEQLLD